VKERFPVFQIFLRPLNYGGSVDEDVTMGNNEVKIFSMAILAFFLLHSSLKATENGRHNNLKVLRKISFTIDPVIPVLDSEGYTLDIKDSITLKARSRSGIIHGIQTLRQLLPSDVEKKQIVSGVVWELPEISILDSSRFQWRGSLLDCCRHFFTKEAVMRYIELLAYYKFNRFHWHLTEDQGWRMESSKYPRLNEIGSWRKEEDGTVYGGFYSRGDIQEIIGYAAVRGIIVVPEIEMPGHAVAALASYPALSCTGGPFTIPNFWGVFEDVYCVGNDSTLSFIGDILKEVIDLFTSPYIHIGGDECPKNRWKQCVKCIARMNNNNLDSVAALQSWFIGEIYSRLKQNNRRMIGWDEILEGGLTKGAMVQSWRGMEGGIVAANAGSDVIMSPTSHCYFDYDNDTTTLDKVYSFDPIPSSIEDDKRKHIVGVEGNLWTERIPDLNRLDSQAFPRICALAEVGWTVSSKRDWGNFTVRMSNHETRLINRGVALYHSALLPPDTAHIPLTVVPRPASVFIGSDRYFIDSSTVIYVPDSLHYAGDYFAQAIAPATGFTLLVKNINTSIHQKVPISHKQKLNIQYRINDNSVMVKPDNSAVVEKIVLYSCSGEKTNRKISVERNQYCFDFRGMAKGVYVCVVKIREGSVNHVLRIVYR
jgi:hypothetical protein